MPSPFKFVKAGQAGIEISEIYPNLAKCIDDICVIRSMHTNLPNHEPSFLMMNSGETQPTRPCMGRGVVTDWGRRIRTCRVRSPLSGNPDSRPATVEQQLSARDLPGYPY